MYEANGQQSRDELVTQHAGLVKKIAYHMIARLPASVQVDDLIQAGMMGLLDAASHYDASQGAAFETYASIRVRGSMLDELRRNDWAPKSVHRKGRELSAAIHRVEMRTGQDASDREVADEMGVTLDEYHKILLDSNVCQIASFDMLSGSGDESREHFADDIPDPTAQLMDQQFQKGLIEAIDCLPEREKLIMSLYYESDLNLKEIGLVIGVSESRVSQLMSQAHGRLRARMKSHTQ
ncbi:MAG: RNA polymerase sigma factor FliA [Gammaproteobacteria bacterium]|nr:RNA polymerase sigma factor FliA [Gammaproteobacteria bacterium]